MGFFERADELDHSINTTEHLYNLGHNIRPR
jgi:hypothetical protein